MSKHDVSDLRPTIVPKSDQLNAEQLLSGAMDLTITDVRIGSDDQPVIIHYTGDDGRPYKPCKTMRKVLIYAWGPDGRQWVGRSIRVYNDPDVRFGGAAVGGIRISNMTDISGDIQVSLTSTKGKKAMHTIKVMQRQAQSVDHVASISQAQTTEELKAAFGAAYKSTRDSQTRSDYKAAYDKRAAELAQAVKQAPDADFVSELDAAQP